MALTNTEDRPFIVAIGASGSEGLDDIGVLLHSLWQPCPAVLMVVLHRPSDKVSHLCNVLSAVSKIPIVVASEAEHMLPGTCYIGEPDGHLTLVSRDSAHLVPGAGGRLRGKTIDTLFHSIATNNGRRSIGVILSGSLDDGSRGLAAIHAAHGVTMVLEPGGKPHGMQQSAIDYDGPISFIGSAKEIADKIGEVVQSSGLD